MMGERRIVELPRWRVAGLLILAAALLPAPVQGEVERIEIARRELVAGGQPFGLAGPYEKLVGKVRFALDPEDPGNALVVDLDKAPRDEDGRVRFVADLYVLKPVDSRRGSGTLLVEVSNRGGKAMVRYFNRGARPTFDPAAPEDFGDGFLLRHGFTLVWVGWQFDVPHRHELLRLYPVHATAVEEPIEGLVRADEVFATETNHFPLGHRNHLAYPVADPEDPRNVLTVRERRLGERRVIPRKAWRFARLEEVREVPDPRTIYLPSGFEKGKIYEAVYMARKPAVVGLGLTAVRDLVSHLKHHPDAPAPGARAIALGISQTGRFLRHFLYQGFNADLEGRRVLDGVLVHTAGAGRGSFNHRFAQPSRDAHPFSAFFFPTDLFPFTDRSQRDPETDLTDGLLRRLKGTPALPKIFFTNTGYEYWGRAAALIHTTVDGKADLPPLPSVRIYHFASTQHFVGPFPPEPRQTRFPENSANFLWSLRALLLAMNAWIQDGVEPPASRYPRLAEKTLTPLEGLTFPGIPGVALPTRPHQAHRVDYGPRFRSQGIIDREPPEVGKAFPILLPQVDEDGNELGGIRLPEIAVPLATYTPWNFRHPDIGAPEEMADFRGSFLPFPKTRARRRAAGDPRRAIEERYLSRSDYLGRYAAAAVHLVRERLLLAEDLPEMLDHAGRLWELVVEEGEGAAPASSP